MLKKSGILKFILDFQNYLYKSATMYVDAFMIVIISEDKISGDLIELIREGLKYIGVSSLVF